MNIHITATPELSTQNVSDVIKVLNETKGPIKFIFSEILQQKRVSGQHPEFNDLSQVELLTFDNLFNYCNTNRLVSNLPVDDYMVVLTSYENDKQYFSCFRGKNIFVHTSDWDKITKLDSKFCVAHQIVENIFQSMMDLNVDDVDNEPNIHKDTTGCINDLCDDEEKVLVKFKSGEICESCSGIASEKEVPNVILVQIDSILEKLRLKFKGLKVKVEPLEIYVDEDGIIKVGEYTLTLDAVHKALFIFFLMNNTKKFRHKDLKNHTDKFKGIYYKFFTGSETDDSPVDSIINNTGSFSNNKSKLKIGLVKDLGEGLAEHYLIKRVAESNISNTKINYYHHIKLPSELINIDPAFIKKKKKKSLTPNRHHNR